MLPFPRPLKFIIEIPIESVRDVRPQQSIDRLEQVDAAGGGASLGVDVECFGGEEVLSRGVAGDLADFVFYGGDAIDGAEGDGDGEGGVRGKECVETV